MTDQTYNGWTNQETWLVHLWLTNDAGLYETARAVVNEPDTMLPEAGANLEELVDDLIEQTGAKEFALDLINLSLSRVNWAEVVQALRDE